MEVEKSQLRSYRCVSCFFGM